MRKVRLQLFQLFLAIFIIYALLYDFPKGILLVRLYQDLILSLYQNLLVSFLCLVCMFLIEKRKKAPDGVVDIPTYREPNLPVVFNSKRGQLHIDKEKREHVRRSVDIPVEFIVQERLYQGRIKNINKEGWIRIGNVNKGGVFVETEISFSIEQNISMTYQSPSFGKENRIGKIVGISPQGIGVKFQRLRKNKNHSGDTI
ncbi:hypothetical protein LCGC14_1846870 [marine sediment metagenome]|uniref:PilZ domain-containing protein n=1 Tax=marine sediment metagenome TaxID=412755 RepID=A0A0F9GZR7_9ZZZZ